MFIASHLARTSATADSPSSSSLLPPVPPPPPPLLLLLLLPPVPVTAPAALDLRRPCELLSRRPRGDGNDDDDGDDVDVWLPLPTDTAGGCCGCCACVDEAVFLSASTAAAALLASRRARALAATSLRLTLLERDMVLRRMDDCRVEVSLRRVLASRTC